MQGVRIEPVSLAGYRGQEPQPHNGQPNPNHKSPGVHGVNVYGKRAVRAALRQWSGTGSNCRPSAFQVNRAERCADLRKRTSLISGTALGGRCKIHANRIGYALSIRQTAALHEPCAKSRCPRTQAYQLRMPDIAMTKAFAR